TNIGRNQLYRNNGDGTLTDVTTAAGLDGDEWTTSCVIVDLNADGLPDLFDVNYVTAPDVYERLCNGHACSPKVFDGTPDRLWINRGDGVFESVPDATPGVNAKGLGVVAFDLHERGRPCLFVANDQVPSFLLRNQRSSNRFGVEFVEDGFAAGLAFNEDGLAMAAMGIAADDVNGDGRIDFYVTTFKDESGILYIQDAAGLFVDGTNRSGLRAPTIPFVGWGTQFLDADLDGAPDLVVANGHVDDYRGEGGEWQMRPQFFRNDGAGRFTELLADHAGPWFVRRYLGRGLTRLDWNHDGKPDFAVSNIGERASLVTNESSSTGHFCHFQLHAVATARDAIGTVVEIEAGGRRWSRQLVAGDGFQASNQRSLMFGVGIADTIESGRIYWPSGHTTELRDVPVDTVIELVEGAPRALLRRGPQLESIAVNPSPTINILSSSVSRGDGF
ncbi:MAG TPA: CRTAC1 family protein, partial [Planctomycetaceae bacterium]|nr:CRTAC1 family protein [Planctomycetaceae bacterium]